MIPPLVQLLLVVLTPKLLALFNVTEKLRIESFWMNFYFHGPKTSSILVMLPCCVMFAFDVIRLITVYLESVDEIIMRIDDFLAD